MPASAKAAVDLDSLFLQLQRRLAESGEWDRILAMLASKLDESGWTDELRHRSKERAKETPDVSLYALLEELSPQFHASVPHAVKRDVVDAIRKQLDKQFE